MPHEEVEWYLRYGQRLIRRLTLLEVSLRQPRDRQIAFLHVEYKGGTDHNMSAKSEHQWSLPDPLASRTIVTSACAIAQ
jgi:hypothetical protein